jgi:two-component system phosphate regulon sensor histidine kinase PhoR
MTTTVFKRVFAALSLVSIVAVSAFFVVGLAALEAAYTRAGGASLAQAVSALAAVIPEEARRRGEAASAWCSAVAASGGYRATIIAPDGSVVADSDTEHVVMENHASRPEVAAALRGNVGIDRRKSATLGRYFTYAASPIAGGRSGVLRLAMEVPTLKAAMSGARVALAAAAFLLLAAQIAAAALVGRSLSLPISRLAAKAKAHGIRTVGDKTEDVLVLSDAIDSMIAEIAERARIAEEQGHRLAAVLDAIPEAVTAVDSAARIVSANRAALDLFGEGAAAGRSILEAFRSTAIQELVEECLAEGRIVRADISLFLPSERSFAATAAPIPGTDQHAAGAVLVLAEVTEIRRLERIRRDFVANVSHELRTPVQLVKGFAEALEDGALSDPEKASRFVGMIGRNAERMEELISDLLSLASLEREEIVIETASSFIAPILESARETVRAKPSASDTDIDILCDQRLEAVVNAGLLEQAVINLLDNAVKYSPPGSRVAVKAKAEGEKLVIEVRDRGIGIPAADIGRIFERFYRVDKARSRELGGTGLGLAIVRHIALAHGGSVSVESWEGEGSTFRMELPLAGPRKAERGSSGTT